MMKPKKSRRLLGLFSSSNPPAFEELLEETIGYGRCKLKCDGGSVFLFDGGTEKLELVASSYEIKDSLSLSLDEGIVSQAYAKQTLIYASQLELSKYHISFPYFSNQQFRGTVAMPVVANHKVVAVFCFDYMAQAAKSISGIDAQNLTSDEKQRAEDLWEEFKSEKFCSSFDWVRVEQLWHDLYSAGEAPANIRQEAGRFITRLQEAFRKEKRRVPEFMSVHIADHYQKLIRTIQAVGMPLSFEIIMAHPFDSDDIQTDIVRKCQVEVIVGNDKKRFNQKVYKKYGHEKYNRMWMPLFPLSVSSIISGEYQSSETALKKKLEKLEWSEEDGPNTPMKSMVARWRRNERPPETLVFGTLEFGYIRENPRELSLLPWNRELVLWCMARAFEFSDGLYQATLSGALDRIGRLLASVSNSDPFRFTCSIPQLKDHEVREYPLSGPWPVAVPFFEDVSTKTMAHLPNLQPIVSRYGKIKIEQFTFSKKLKSPNKSSHFERIQRLNILNANFAASAVEKAYSHYTDALTVYELQFPHEDPKNVGTIVPDEVILSVFKQAHKRSRSICCGYYYFEKKILPNSKVNDIRPWLVYPPLKLTKIDVQELPWEDVKEVARMVAKEKYPQYINPNSQPINSEYALCLLPLDLSDDTTSVIVFVFSNDHNFSSQEKRRLEGLVHEWVHQISLRQLCLKNRFSNFMIRLRQNIAEACNFSEKKEGNITHVSTFIQEVLKRITEQIKPLAVVMTLFNKTETGPSRLERYWACSDNSSSIIHIDYFKFIDKDFLGPCYDACHHMDLVIHSDRAGRSDIFKVVHQMKSEAIKMEQTGEIEMGKRLRLLSEIIQGNDEDSTFVTIPALEKGDKESGNQAALTLILPGEHWFDEIHRMLIREIGDLIAGGITRMRNLDGHDYEAKHARILEQRRKRFESAKELDEIIEAFLHRLGHSTKESNDTSLHNHNDHYETWGLAEDAVIWDLSGDYNELVVHSGRGKGLQALKVSKNLEIINPIEHPLLTKIKIFIKEEPQKGRARIEGPSSFWTLSLERTQKGQAINKICQAYGRTGRKWLLTFPIIDALDQIYGVIDLLCDEPPPVEEEAVLKRVLNQLSRQFCSAVMRCNLMRTRRISNDLYTSASKMLRVFNTQDVYMELVQRMKEEFHCKHCDLFLERHGRMLLHTTTRPDGPSSDKDRFKYIVKPSANNEEILGACYNTAKAMVQHTTTPPRRLDHLSLDLQNIMADDFRQERMVFPLMAMIEDLETVVGLFHLQGPRELSKIRSILFTAEQLQLGLDLALTLQRIVQMVRLVEQQGWLVEELVHSLGSPLQELRSNFNKLSKLLVRSDNIGIDKAQKIYNDINRDFDMVHEARDQLGFLSRLSQPERRYKDGFEGIKIKELVAECCDFLEKTALADGQNSIDYTHVQAIDLVPVEKTWFRKALLNLIGNACKYSWKGRPIEVKAMEDRKGSIKIQVTNWGIGIPHDQKKRVFEPYFSSNVPDARGTRPGTGFGLAIVNEAIERIHKGAVSFKSVPFENAKNEISGSISEITNVEHKTTFTIMLWREILIKLSELKH